MTNYEIDRQALMVNFFYKKVKKNLVITFFYYTFVSETRNELKYDKERNQQLVQGTGYTGTFPHIHISV